MEAGHGDRQSAAVRPPHHALMRFRCDFPYAALRGLTAAAACVPPGAQRPASCARPSERQRVLEYEVQRHGKYQIHKPESRTETEEAQRPLRRAAELRQVRLETREEVDRIHADQADEHATH